MAEQLVYIVDLNSFYYINVAYHHILHINKNNILKGAIIHSQHFNLISDWDFL